MPETATFDHYEVLTRDDGSLYELGRGAMGITYKAFDTSLRFPVALKVINATYLNSEVARQRFIREARSAAKLRHRNVASVFHLGTEGDTWFYAMEFIDGETLEALIKRQGPLAPKTALAITGQVARALNAASQHGLVHRDIKPANLMLVHEDEDVVAKVIDFGLAKTSLAADGEDSASLSLGGFVGTPHFASPEQLEEREIDVRSDIYSLGVTLWYMLAGQAPFGGSMAQVMSQHLSKPPPFEKFKTLPPPVSELLRKMLEKDPGSRFQTPAELRKVIDETLAKISNAPAAAAPEVDEEDFSTLLEDASQRPGETRFEPGATIAGRYRITEALGETNTGRIFRAEDRKENRPARLIVLHPEFLRDSAACTAIEREVERLAQVQHPNLLGVFDFATIESASFLAMEWTDGFSLLELLRARRELSADEAIALLKQAAAGADYAVRRGLTGLEFGLHQVALHFPASFQKETLLRAPIADWPEFTLKLYPLGVARDLASSQTWAGAQTIVGGAAERSSGAADVRARYVRSLAALIYELLGGTLSPIILGNATGLAAARYTPLSTLSEEGNEVLKRALDPAGSFAGAQEFCTALAQLHGLQAARRELPPVAVKAKPSPPPVVPAPVQPGPLKPRTIPPGKKKFPAAFFSTVVTAFAIGGAVYYFAHKTSPEIVDYSTPSPVQTPAPVPTPPPGPTVIKKSQDEEKQKRLADALHAAEELEKQGNVEGALEAYQNVVRDFPEKGNDVGKYIQTLLPKVEQIRVAKAVKVAEATEEQGDVKGALDGYLKVARDYPDTGKGVARNHIETMLDRVGRREKPLGREEFQAMKAEVVEAAKLEVLSAMLLLGENLRKEDPQSAFMWFSKAAKTDSASAIMQVGLMLSNGIPGVTERDLPAAVQHLQKSVDLGFVPAKYYLGECYLEGKGVPKDEKMGVKLLREAIEAKDARALNKLGAYLAHSDKSRPDSERIEEYQEAFQLLTRARELGNLEAVGNLAVLYMKGIGTGGRGPEPAKGFALYEEGAKKGNAVCMAMYAYCLETGFGTKKNMLMAETWYRKAAEAGERTGIDWVRAHPQR